VQASHKVSFFLLFLHAQAMVSQDKGVQCGKVEECEVVCVRVWQVVGLVHVAAPQSL